MFNYMYFSKKYIFIYFFKESMIMLLVLFEK